MISRQLECKHKIQVLAGGDDEIELSYITVATTVVMLTKCGFLRYSRVSCWALIILVDLGFFVFHNLWSKIELFGSHVLRPKLP